MSIWKETFWCPKDKQQANKQRPLLRGVEVVTKRWYKEKKKEMVQGTGREGPSLNSLNADKPGISHTADVSRVDGGH